MAAPSKAFTTILDARIAADQPLDQSLIEDIRDNIRHLEEWLGGSYTAAVDHDHDDVNSKAISLSASIKRLATPVSKISVTGQTVPPGFTNIDISADTGSDTAAWALFAVTVSYNLSVAGDTSTILGAGVKFRDDGDTDDAPDIFECYDQVEIYNPTGASRSWGGGTRQVVWVPLTSEICEYDVVRTGSVVWDLDIVLVGYSI